MAVKRVGTRTPQRKVTRGMSSALFDTMSQGVVYQDTEGGITAANPSAERILGLTLDQMTGRTSMDPRWRAIREDGSDFPGNEHPAMVALRTGKQVNDVMMGVFHPKEGEYRWILVNAVPEFDSGKKRPLRVLVTFTDVTDRKRAEEALRASEDKFSKAFRVSPDSININRMSDGLFLEANEGFTTLTGYTKEDVLGRTSLEINIWAHSEDRQRLMNGLQKDGEVANLEASFRSKDGSTRTGLMSARIINVNGEQCILSITRDITERKQVEWALRHSEERYRNLVENISEIFFIVDHRGKIVYGSPNLFSSTGYEEGELIGKSYVGLVAREDRLRITEFYEQRTLDGTIDCRCEFLARMKTGRSVWVEQVTRIIRNEAGSVVQYWNVVRDITERKQIEEALHKSEEKYRALIETTDTGYVIIDDEGKVLDANQEYVRLTGRKNLVDILNHSVLEWTAGSDRTRNAEAVRQCMAQGFIRDLEIEYIHDDGTRVPIQIDATVMKTGSRTNILTLCRDITEHRQAEEMRRESNARVHAIVDGAPFGAHSYELHSDGRLIFSGGNRSADRVLGMDHSLLIGKTIEEAFPPLATTSVPNAYRHVAVTGERYEADQVDYEDDRIRGAFEIHAFQTGINRMTVFFRDITERKRAELALKESEGRLRTIIETEPECVKVVDRDGRVLEMNAAGLAMLEADTLGEVQQRVLLEFILPEHRAAFRALHERVMNGEGGTLEFEAMGLKGTRRWLETHAAPMRSATGEITRLLGVSRDITERKRAEEAMREKEHLLSESQRIAHIGSWKFEMNGTNLWTDETYRIYGVSPDSFIPTAESFFALIHPDDRNVMRDWIEKCASGNNPGEFDFRTILPDGTIRCLSGQGELICDGEKKPLYMTGTVQDITERTRAERALRESEQRYQTLTEASPVGVFRTNANGYTTYVNPRWCQLSGLPAEEAQGDGWLRAVHVEDREKLSRGWKESSEAHKDSIAEYRFVRPDGTIVWVMGQAVPELDAMNQILGYIGTITDITDRKRAEETGRLLSHTMEGISEIATITDLEDRLTFVNEAFVRTYGYDRSEVLGRHVGFLWSPNNPAGLLNEILRQSRTGSWKGEILNLTKDGREFPLSLHTSQVRDEHGTTIGLVGISEDITARKQLEAQLHQAQKMEAIGRLAGGVAHDFNNMIGVILGYAKLIENHLNPLDPLHRNVQAIASAAERSANLTKQLLAFARKQVIAPVPLNLNESLSLLQKMLMRLIGEDIALTLLPSDHLWNIKIDPTQVDQILANLATNARDAIDDVGTITIETANISIDQSVLKEHPEFTPGEYVVLAFSDTGKGMDKTTQERIFEPFFTTKEEGRGTGLGLATVFGIVKQNNGFIHVYSEPGQGSTFKIYLPRFYGEAEAPTEGREEVPLKGTETVLVVEDEEQLLELSCAALEMFGYTVLSAKSPGEAILLSERTEKIDLLVTDVVMPGMNGKELKERLDTMRPGMKTIFMSGYTADVVANRGILNEGVFFLQKPFTPQALAKKVREVLNG